jgi:galactitol-specific phosphotransferase system IIC component
MKFNSRKGLFIKAVLFMSTIAIIALFSIDIYNADKFNLIKNILFALVLIPLFAIYFQTYYTITPTDLLYKSGIIKGSIQINSIKQIQANKTKYIGLKPALATKGLIISYNKWEDIYVSPEHAETFIAELLKINSKIEVKYN